MSTEKPKKSRSSKATKADLEAKIAELEAKLNAASQIASKPAPAPQPKPEPRPAETKPEPRQAETKPEPRPAETKPEPKPAEVAPAYASVSSEKYTGNRYYATRQRLAYHPPDKQFTGGQIAVTVQVSPPSPEPEPQQAPEPEPAKREEPRRIEPPAPRVVYTGTNYYATRQRLAYHPPDKQFREAVAVKFTESPSAETVEAATSSQSESQQTASKSQKSRAAQLAEYEREYLERIQQQKKAEAEKPAPATKKSQGTMPAGWKPS